MQAGHLDQRITIQRRTVTGQDTYGKDIVSWTTNTYGPFWAAIEPLNRGREAEAGQQTWAETWLRVRMRYPDSTVTIKREDRVRWGTRVLDIKEAEDPRGFIGRKRELHLICREFVS